LRKKRDAILSEIDILLRSKKALFSAHVRLSLSAANGNEIKFKVNKISIVRHDGSLRVDSLEWVIVAVEL